MRMRTIARAGALATVAAASGAAALVAVQAWHVRRNTPRLRPAPEPHHGHVDGLDPALSVAVVGESTAAGVGVRRHAEGLAGRFAQGLAAQTGRAVRWQVVGRSGATVASMRNALRALKGPLDVVVLAFGVNDVIALHGARRYMDDLHGLVHDLRGEHGRRLKVVLAGVPPMAAFPALPRPLADVLGWRSRVLDEAAMKLAARSGAIVHVPCEIDGPDGFALDGFHPGAGGYASWAASLAAAAAALVRA